MVTLLPFNSAYLVRILFVSFSWYQDVHVQYAQYTNVPDPNPRGSELF